MQKDFYYTKEDFFVFSSLVFVAVVVVIFSIKSQVSMFISWNRNTKTTFVVSIWKISSREFCIYAYPLWKRSLAYKLYIT